MAKKAVVEKKVEKVEKESTMDLFDLRDNKIVLKINGTVEIEKIPVWDKTTRGNMLASYLIFTVTTAKGVTKMVAGCKRVNMWMGKAKDTEAKVKEDQVLEI